MTPFQTFAYWMGLTVLAAGGVGVLAVVLWIVGDQLFTRTTNLIALGRILRYARKEGIDLTTGERIDPEIPA